jgi:hypothetical protein
VEGEGVEGEGVERRRGKRNQGMVVQRNRGLRGERTVCVKGRRRKSGVSKETILTVIPVACTVSVCFTMYSIHFLNPLS